MVKEFSNEFNSFNSWKGLMYVEHYRAILAGKFLPPIECSIDPVNACNMDCVWCNGSDVRSRGVMMSWVHLRDLIRFIKDWGAKAICFAGGGEPTMHPQLDLAVNLCASLDLPVAIITNGAFINEHGQDMLAGSLARNCRWIGVSVDCSTKETFYKLKRSDLFDRVISNIAKLTSLKAREVTYKFLLHPDNQHEVYQAALLAKELGCQRIHIRPVSFMNFQDHEDKYDIDSIDEQVLKARGLENDNFHVFYVQHKYNKDMHRKFGFKKCLATPIMPIFQADNSISLCIDRKADKSLVIGSHKNINDIPKIWGSEKHKQVIDSVQLESCPKCTIQPYQQQIEHLEDFDWEFT